MNQLVQALYKGSNIVVNGHNISNESDVNYRDSPSSATTDGDGEEVIPVTELYKKIQHGGDIPFKGLQKPAPEKPKNFRHQTSDVIRKSLPCDEKKIDEGSRKKQLEKMFEEGRRRRLQAETEKNASRKHHDFFIPAEKALISPNRYQDVVVGCQQSSSPQYHWSRKLQENKLEAHCVSPGKWQNFLVQGKARALYNFTAQNPRELSFKRGDVVYLLHVVDINWLLGEHYGQVGIFPANYVEILPSAETVDHASLKAVGLARAKFSFLGESSNELSLKKGDFVTVLRRVDQHWLEGCVGEKQGIFPLSYVDLIQEPSIVTPTMAGTPEMLSPVSWKTPTPPLQPSPSVLTKFLPATSAYSLRHPKKFLYGSQSSDEHTSLEFTNFSNKGFLSPPTSEEEFGITFDSPKTPEPTPVGTEPDLEISFGHSSTGSDPDNKFWSDKDLQRHKAMSAFTPQDELELMDDDELLVMEKCDDGWFVGTPAGTGKFGIFPNN